MPKEVSRDAWDIAYDQLMEVMQPPTPRDLYGLEGDLEYKWLEEMGTAFAPDHYPLVVAPLDFFLFYGSEPSWDEKLDAHSRYYERLKARRLECDSAHNKLSNIRVEPPSVRAKHWPLPRESNGDIRQRVMASNPVASCFYYGVTPELLTLGLVDVLCRDLDRWWPPPSHSIIDVCAMTVIGCSGRGDTRFVRFDCSFDSLSAHAYPIDGPEPSGIDGFTPFLLGAVPFE